MKPTRTWILVADGGRARILEAVGRGKGVHLVPGSEKRLDNPPSHLQGRDRPSRVHESVGHTRHAVEPRQDLHRAMEDQFAGQLAAMLGDYAQKDSYDQLVLVAPPTMLGELRKALPSSARERLAAEVDKDLTHVGDADIPSHIENVIAL
ncbi:host attachment protein [Hyphomicrobium sp.]|uniref:host attachment protein n=1 Tax=Hyphomicrobium sp. TaxID=82 RepID=UPI002D77CCE5|nr:host attachment protein [Hyphomicrobium sp.]HET6387985.1 host attachment protein [Hyphomicrobium sp.]